MQQFFNNIINASWGTWRFRWTALIIAWLVCLLGWTFIMSLDYKYTSKARIFVDTNRVLEPLLIGITLPTNVTKQVSLVSKALLTRPNIELLAAKVGLDKEANTKAERDYLYADIESNIKLYPVGRDQSIYAIEFENTSPDVAQDVVNQLIAIFIDSNLVDEQEDNDQAQRFLNDRIAEYEVRLSESEQRLTEFKRRNAGSMPSEAGGFYKRLQDTKLNLRMAKSELRESINKRDELNRQLQKESSIAFVSDTSGTAQRIIDLRRELDTVLQGYTDQHPDAIHLRGYIGQLERQLKVESSQRISSDRMNQDNVVYQTLRPIVAEAQATVAELKARVWDFEDQVAELESTVDSIPKVEAQLKQLDRDYETNKSQHAQLLERREAARLSILKRGNDDSKFKIIEPPELPLFPSSPNKPLLYIGVLLAALGTALAVASLLSLFKPVYFEQRTLQMQTGLPVFGTVTVHRSKQESHKRHMTNMSYYACFGMLLVLLVLIVVVTLTGSS